MEEITFRRSIRYPGFDYTDQGAYFITICTFQKRGIFGEISDEGMQLNEMGKIVKDCWQQIPAHFPQTDIDEYIIMPNHVHGILWIKDPRRGTTCRAQTETFGWPVSGSIPTMVRSFKAAATKRIREMNPTGEPIWQRNYYERIIRNEQELSETRQYIVNNPLKWDLDPEYT